jgi:hypothetical protein
MKKPLSEFKSAHATLKHATQHAEDTFLLVSEADHDIAAADAALDSHVEALASALVGAGLATRTRPFDGYSKHAPSKLVKLAVATKVKETRAIARKVAAKRANAAVKGAAKALAAKADATAAALGGVSGPTLQMRKARGAIDAAVAPWQSAYERLKKYAAVAWIDDADTYKSLFAPPDRVQAPKKTRAPKKKAETATPPAPPAPPSP